jgi:hypothetical protein
MKSAKKKTLKLYGEGGGASQTKASWMRYSDALQDTPHMRHGCLTTWEANKEQYGVKKRLWPKLMPVRVWGNHGVIGFVEPFNNGWQ